jgi:predicted regulator of Ras-like GTPase activity (Roadblock/LC7/MglB family)
VISNSTDINGLAVVGIDGLVYSVNSPVGNLDETLIGAVAAAALGLSKRSTEQLQRGAFQQTLIQGDKGNIVVTQINPETLLIAITNHGVNLGMVFAETKRCVTTLHEIL